jgi:hypothetical protein
MTRLCKESEPNIRPKPYRSPGSPIADYSNNAGGLAIEDLEQKHGMQGNRQGQVFLLIKSNHKQYKVLL